MRRSQIPISVALVALFSFGAYLLTRPGLPAPERAARSAVVLAAVGANGGAAEAATAGRGVVAGVTVNVAALPAGVDLDDTPYARWLRGEADLEQEPLPAMAPPAPSGNVTVPEPAGGTTEAGFALEKTFFGPNFLESGSMPADPVLAVGLNHVIAAVNGAFKVYNKNGQVLLETRSIRVLFDRPGLLPGCANHPFDPDLLYDEAADRFILLTAGMSGTIGDTLCVAASASGDPTGAWHLYTFAVAPHGSFFDFPQGGIGRDALYLGANNVGATDGPGQVWAFDKQALYAGDPVSSVTRMLGSALTLPTPNPIHLTGLRQSGWPTDVPHYFVAHHYNAATYDLFAWDDPFGANAWSLVGTFDLNSATGVPAAFPIASPQQAGESLSGNDSRLWDVDYRNGSIWLTMHVSCDPGSGPVNCVRWARVAPETAAVLDAGVLGSADRHRIYPSLAVNRCDDLLLGYTTSDEASYPAYQVSGIAGSGSEAGLPLELLVRHSSTAYDAAGPTPQRWGDYSALVVDPDGATLWTIGPYAATLPMPAAANWYTVIGAFTFDNCQALPTHDLFLPIVSRR